MVSPFAPLLIQVVNDAFTRFLPSRACRRRCGTSSNRVLGALAGLDSSRRPAGTQEDAGTHSVVAGRRLWFQSALLWISSCSLCLPRPLRAFSSRVRGGIVTAVHDDQVARTNLGAQRRRARLDPLVLSARPSLALPQHPRRPAFFMPFPRLSVEPMSADPARPGPPGASPSASSVGASPAGSKPASTSLSAPAAAALSAAALKPASKPRSSIFERVRVAALRNGLAPTSSSGGLAAMAAAAMTPTSALGSPALADRAPRPAGSPSLEPGLGGVSTARMTAPTSSKPSKPSDEADEAAIEHALFSSPEKVARSLPPPSPPKLTMAHPSSSQASAAEPVPSGRSADTPQTVPTFKKRVNASGAVTPTVARSPVPTVVGARRPSLELGDKVRPPISPVCFDSQDD